MNTYIVTIWNVSTHKMMEFVSQGYPHFVCGADVVLPTGQHGKLISIILQPERVQ